MASVSYGDRNWAALFFVVFFLALIFLDGYGVLGGTFDEGARFIFAVGMPLWVGLVVWSIRLFVRGKRFYCTTPSCAITGRKRVFMRKAGEWICTQCKRPLTPNITAFPQQLQPIEAPSFSGSLGNTFLGGFAGLRIYRYKGSGEVSIVSGVRNPWGYGIYFTDGNVIGVSYTKYLSRAYKPGWILSITWIGLLALTVAYFGVTHAQELPLWWIPIFPFSVFGSAIMSLVFLLYLSPKRASSQINSIQLNSIKNLETTDKDVIVRRDDISEISFRRTRVREPGISNKSGLILSISSRKSQPAIFVITNKEKPEMLVQLVQEFARHDPQIPVTQN